MNSNKYFTGTLILFFGLVCLSSCKKFIEIAPPQNQIQTSEIFKNDQAAISAAMGLYSKMSQFNLMISNGGMTFYGGFSSDEMYNTNPDSDIDAFVTNSLIANSGTGLSIRLWNPAFSNIYHANAILEGLDGGSVTDSLKKRLKGEVLFARSLNYFCLINLFGDVPFQTSTNYEINSRMARTPKSEIYQYLVRDLIIAQGLLPESYPSVNKARPNKWTATALLARIYLYMGDWVNAEAQTTSLLNSNAYTMATLASAFTTTSVETIWQLIRDNNNTAEGAIFIPSSATVKPPYALTSGLVNSFLVGDQRKTSWLAKNTVSGVDYYYPNKYKSRLATQTTEYYIVFRLAEQYLIRAEARARQNDILNAQSDLNKIRNRAGLGNTTANTQADLLLAIEQERRIELFIEWGHRWLDLKRTNRADAVLGITKAPNWQPNDALYPIPLNEILTNPFLTQNPGY